MAEINEPTPIKPVWPSRREQRPFKQNRPEDEEKKRRNRQPDERNREKPHIDEYA